MRGARSTVAVCVAALVVATAGCSPAAKPFDAVLVTGEPGGAPELEYETPLVVTSPIVEVVIEGTGPEVVDGEPILVNFYAESGADGSLINETYSSEPRPYVLSEQALGVDIHAALSGQRVGSRILHVMPPAEGEEAATVAVFDILPTRASGEPVAPREGLPTVELAADGTPTVTIPDTPPPTELVAQPLQRGLGAQVTVGQIITVQFVTVTWSGGSVVDSSWADGGLPSSFPIGAGSVIAGWDAGLVEQPVGSQILLVVPPGEAYGGSRDPLAEETLVFVVDILSAVGGPVAEVGE